MATRAEWTERVKRWKRSGLSAPEFARREGLKAKQIHWSGCRAVDAGGAGGDFALVARHERAGPRRPSARLVTTVGSREAGHGPGRFDRLTSSAHSTLLRLARRDSMWTAAMRARFCGHSGRRAARCHPWATCTGRSSGGAT